METQCSRCGFTSAEYRGSITALVLLVTLFLNTRQDDIGLLGLPGTLTAHAQPSVNLHPQGASPAGSLPATLAQACSVVGGCCDPCAELALLLVELHTTGLIQMMQPVQMPPQSFTTLMEINTATPLDVVCKLTESALNPLVWVTDEVLKQDWPQH